jgi:hypothetical protein
MVRTTLKNQVGAGMMMAMMVMGAMGGAGMIIAEMFLNSQSKVLQRDARIEAYRHMVDLTRRNLYASNNCSMLLGSGGDRLDITSAMGKPEGAEIKLPLKLGPDNLTYLEPGWKSSTGTSIKAVHLKLMGQPLRAGPASVRIHNDPVPKVAQLAQIILEPDHRGVNIFKKNDDGSFVHENLFIRLMLYHETVDGQTRIHSCFDPASEAAFCTVGLRGAYNTDVSLPAMQRGCQPDLQCFTYRQGIMPLGSACPAPYTATQVGGGMQVCNWCHPQPVPAGVGAILGAFSDIDQHVDELDCSSSGYAELTAQEEWETYQEHAPYLGYLTGDQYAAHASCLNYQPTPPPPPPQVAPTPVQEPDPNQEPIYDPDYFDRHCTLNWDYQVRCRDVHYR